ncbi:hypothetical protein [Micromonospora sp. NPDC005979]|uniref:hypothetical protein n=1 Tax=Micromonospora sp. NPDC005979 TaxID=3156726 RepID=UPI0033BAD69D
MSRARINCSVVAKIVAPLTWGGDTVNIVQRLRRLLTPALPPVPPGTGQRIQAAEQEAAKRRLLGSARTMTQGHRPDGPVQ